MEKGLVRDLQIGEDRIVKTNPPKEIPMTNYRIPELDLSTRLDLAVRMIDPYREWGEVTKLAREYNISRKFLYEQQSKVEQAMRAALEPQRPGPREQVESMEIHRDFLRRAALVMVTAVPGSIRGLQLAMELLFGKHRATGWISERLQEFGETATDYITESRLEIPELGEADEIFQGKHPCLTVVDGRSFLVLNLSAEQGRDATTWGTTFLEPEERGVEFQDIACDGARGIRAGVREAELRVPLRPDLFHLIRDGHPITRSLDAATSRTIEVSEKARRAEQEAGSIQKRRGPRLKSELTLPEALSQGGQAIFHYEAWHWLFDEVRLALEPFDIQGQLKDPDQTRETVKIAAELRLSLNLPRITGFVQKKLLAHLDELLAPLVWLSQALSPWRTDLDPKTEAFIVWSWKHRQAFDLIIENHFPAQLHLAARGFWETLDLFHRSSSLAESLHSWLRPHFVVHRGMPNWLLPLLQLFWNHHSFQRGKRQGKSPLAWAGFDDAPSLAELINLLLNYQPAFAAT
jgi:hypothetical protein